uniref:Uncharacterized protein n=1 Tax=Populus trichocarpa TaxID=3694 RepID=A0A3N7G608_POPTR
MGTRRACQRNCEADVLPFQVVNHGPPPTSTSAMSGNLQNYPHPTRLKD